MLAIIAGERRLHCTRWVIEAVLPMARMLVQGSNNSVTVTSVALTSSVQAWINQAFTMLRLAPRD
jgi:hypothetical protein